MKILVINAGSSSLKYRLMDVDGPEEARDLCAGLVERIGEDGSVHSHTRFEDGAAVRRYRQTARIETMSRAMEEALALILAPETGGIGGLGEIEAVGHRAAHGGEAYRAPVLVDARVKDTMRGLFILSPIHNPANLRGMETAEKLCPGVPNVAVFDTGFHATIPEEAYRYALPQEYYTSLGVRRYGFHGCSHAYVSRETARLLGKPAQALNLITCHLGSGSSLTAIRQGQSIGNSMPFGPAGGVIMASRCGDVDPSIALYLSRRLGLDLDQLGDIFAKRSGLLALCGLQDMRDIHAARQKGDERAELAFRMLCLSIKRYIGMYFAELGRVDAITFTAGIGENDPLTRAGALEGLEPMGIELDGAANGARASGARCISRAASRVKVFVVPTNEELEIALATYGVVRARSA